MTTDKTPLDKYLLPLIKKHFGLDAHRDGLVIERRTGRFHDVQRYQDFAADILAKWGSPVAAREPWGASVGGRVWVGKLPAHVTKLAEAEGLPIQWLYTTPPALGAQQVEGGDAELLDFLCDPARLRMVECEKSAHWRVYQDEAPAAAPQHLWQAMTSLWHPTARAAIRAARAAQKEG